MLRATPREAPCPHPVMLKMWLQQPHAARSWTGRNSKSSAPGFRAGGGSRSRPPPDLGRGAARSTSATGGSMQWRHWRGRPRRPWGQREVGRGNAWMGSSSATVKLQLGRCDEQRDWRRSRQSNGGSAPTD